MSSLSIASSIYRHTSCSNVAVLAHQGGHTMGETPLLSTQLPAPPLGPDIPLLILDIDLESDHTKLQRHGVLLGPATSLKDYPGLEQSCACRLLVADSNGPVPVKYLCVTEAWPKAAQEHSQVSSLLSDTARQTQVHESGYAIHRLMPPDRIIYFSIDRDSFRLSGVSDEVTNTVIASAEAIVSFIEKQNLGINFGYRPSSDSSTVFEIRYDPSLARKTAAQSFLPSDPRPRWELRISRSVVTSECNIRYLPNILAHEFGHILGLRHWNANTDEAALPSFHWPNTQQGCRRSVMYTNAPPWEIRFSREDLRVIQEMYSFPNGYVLDGREIIDVYP